MSYLWLHMTELSEAPLSGYRLFIYILVLSIGNFIALSNVPGYTIIAPHAAGALQGVTPSFGTWGTTDHMIGIVLGLPLARWFGNYYGEYRTYVKACLIYACFAFLCATSESIYFFVSMRFFLGLTGGVILPLGQALFLKEITPSFRTYAVSYWAVLSMLPFTFGVFMGGYLAEFLNWRSLFYLDIFIGIIVASFVEALLHGRHYNKKISRFDWIGFALLLIIVLGVQTMLNQGNDFDWFASPFLMLILVVVVGSVPAFIIWELGERRPVLDLRLFYYRNYAVAAFCSVIGFLFIQGALSVFVGQLHILIGYTSEISGAIYLLMALFAIPTIAMVHKFIEHIDLRYLASFNFIGFSIVFTWIGLFDKTASFDQIGEPMAFFGFWLATFFAPMAALSIKGLHGDKLIRAAEELTMLRTAAGSAGITLLGVIQFRLAPWHQLDLADFLGGRRFASLDQLPNLINKFQLLGMTEPMAKATISRFMRQQSLLLGLNDAFFTGALAFIFLACVVWLAKPKQQTSIMEEKSLKSLEAEELMEQP